MEDDDNVAHPGDIDAHDNVERTIDCVRKAYDWCVSDDGRLAGLVSSDYGWSSTHIVLEADAIHDNLKFPDVDPKLDGMSPMQASALWWFLTVLLKSGGHTDSSDGPYNWINAFCGDDDENGVDTFNRACDMGFVSTTHETSYDTSLSTLTEHGRAWLTVNPTAWHASRAAERGLLIDALEPFATWGREGDGTPDWDIDALPLNDRVVDWFGRSDFRRARKVFDLICSKFSGRG
jgi:hypothetical protein